MKFISTDLNIGTVNYGETLLFLMPETSLILKHQPFFIPDFSNDVRVHAEPVVRINKVGKNIQQKYADRYFDEIGIGVRFVAADLLKEYKKNGFPWEKAVAFDGCLAISSFISKKDFLTNGGTFSLHLNQKEAQSFHVSQMTHDFDKLIAVASKYFMLKTGDIILGGISENEKPIKINDTVDAYLNAEKFLSCKVK